uniref:Coat protein n=1 Tax=Soybean chlorotic mottle virus TaxID=10651 RepID=A0A4D6TXW5_SOCMV|nr:coat protein [Soybean chlorotic mottle virus]
MEETQQELTQQLKELETLMAAINLDDSKNKQPVYQNSSESEESETENKNFIYDFSSEEDFEEPVKVKIEEEAETSNKRKFERNPEFTRFKYQKIPKEYVPAHQTTSTIGILDIDCVANTEKIIKEWFNHHSILITINEELKNLSSLDTFYYLVYKTKGIAHAYLSNLPSEVLSRIPADRKQVDDWVYNLLLREFVGRLERPESEEAFSQNNYYKLINLEIYNMCYLENFLCEFQSRYYGINPIDRENLKVDLLLFAKLPEYVRTQVEAYFSASIVSNKLDNTLGGRITALKLWQTEQCNQKLAKRQASVGLCCSKIEDKIGKYGCRKSNPRTRKPKKKFRKIKRYSKKNFWKWNNQRKKKTFRKKRPFRKQQTCPTGKKKCQCWLCHEEGHYANECPKKDNKKAQTLKLIFDLGFEPVESDIETDEELFELTSEDSSEDEY